MAPKMEKAEIHAFAAELAKEFGVTVDPAYSNHHWAFALNLEPGVGLFAAIENGKARYSLIAHASGGRSVSVEGECGVSVARGATVAADAIRSRLLPEALPRAHAALGRFRRDDDRAARIARKAEQLANRYPNLKIRVDQQDKFSIQIATKYGAGIQFDAYAYENEKGEFRMPSKAGRGFSIDNIESKCGRAFLKLCNDS